MADPVRLLDDPEAPADVRSDLARASAHWVHDGDRDRARARLLAALAAGTTLGASETAAGAVASSGAAGSSAGSGGVGSGGVGSGAAGGGAAGGGAAGGGAGGVGATGGVAAAGGAVGGTAAGGVFVGSGGAMGSAAAASGLLNGWLFGAFALALASGGGALVWLSADQVPSPQGLASNPPEVAAPSVDSTSEDLISESPNGASFDESSEHASPSEAGAPIGAELPLTFSHEVGAIDSVHDIAPNPPRERRTRRQLAPHRPRSDSPARVLAELRRETELMDSERRAAQSGDPRRALELARQGAREFPRGDFVVEREAWAIVALSRLGRTDEVEMRRTRFLAAHPRSPQAEMIRRLGGAHR